MIQGGWKLNPDLRVRVWDSDVLVYVPASGDTHLLEDRLSLAFQQLARRDVAHSALAESLDDEAVNTLVALGIAVEAVASCG